MHPPRPLPVLLASALVVIVGCADEASTPTPQAEPTLETDEATRLIEARFPDAEVTVESARVDGDRAVVAATFNGTPMDLILTPSESDGGWTLVAAESEHLASSANVEDLEQISETMVDMKDLAGALAAYRTANGTFPSGDGIETLAALVPGYLPEGTDFTDAWMQEYRYGTASADQTYTLTSAGPDRTLATEDDIVLHEGDFLRRTPS